MPLIKETNYNLLTKQLQSLIEDEQNLIAILSNTYRINFSIYTFIKNNKMR